MSDQLNSPREPREEPESDEPDEQGQRPCRILVVQQGDSGRPKIEGIQRHGDDRFVLSTWDVPTGLPRVLDETDAYLPEELDADMVLDFVDHPDVSQDLVELCREKGVPVVAPGAGGNLDWAYTPPV